MYTFETKLGKLDVKCRQQVSSSEDAGNGDQDRISVSFSFEHEDGRLFELDIAGCDLSKYSKLFEFDEEIIFRVVPSAPHIEIVGDSVELAYQIEVVNKHHAIKFMLLPKTYPECTITQVAELKRQLRTYKRELDLARQQLSLLGEAFTREFVSRMKCDKFAEFIGMGANLRDPIVVLALFNKIPDPDQKTIDSGKMPTYMAELIDAGLLNFEVSEGLPTMLWRWGLKMAPCWWAGSSGCEYVFNIAVKLIGLGAKVDIKCPDGTTLADVLEKNNAEYERAFAANMAYYTPRNMIASIQAVDKAYQHNQASMAVIRKLIAYLRERGG